MVDKLMNSEANTKRISFVENCFGHLGVPLAMAGRVLVGEGVLTKMCRKKPKPRQFYLMSDILVYGTIVINKKKFASQHIIPLEEVKLEDLKDDGVMKNGWLMKTSRKSFKVYAATPTEKAEWMAHINKCITDLLRRTGKKATDDHAAVWIPDVEANKCMHCKKVQFTMINRRHHCRQCGAVVCGHCSKNKFFLSSGSTKKPVRVCDACYSTLSKQRTCSLTINDQPDPIEEIKNVDIKEAKIAEEFQATSKESSDSDDSDDDEDIVAVHSEDDGDDLSGALDAVSLAEKPTFYKNSFNIEDEALTKSEETEEIKN